MARPGRRRRGPRRRAVRPPARTSISGTGRSCPTTPSARTTSTRCSSEAVMAGAAPQPKNRQSNSHIVALLSLKILLLDFFILLNALATFQEERSSAVVDSVRDEFPGLLPVGRRGDAEHGGGGLFVGGGDCVDNLVWRSK